jgi:carbamoyltransferase
MSGGSLGPAFEDDETSRRLTPAGARFASLSEEKMLDRTAKGLAKGNAIGWFQNRMEFGPPALGAEGLI